MGVTLSHADPNHVSRSKKCKQHQLEANCPINQAPIQANHSALPQAPCQSQLILMNSSDPNHVLIKNHVKIKERWEYNLWAGPLRTGHFNQLYIDRELKPNMYTALYLYIVIYYSTCSTAHPLPPSYLWLSDNSTNHFEVLHVSRCHSK